jgi:hypothetical protein
MAKVSTTNDDIKFDVKELVDIVVADKIPIKRINECRSFTYRKVRRCSNGN